MIKSTLRYRNLYGELHKERWDGTKPMTTSSDSNLIKGGSRYIGFSFFSSGGGRLAILTSKNTGKWQHDAKMIVGHNGPILDLDFFPYNDSYVATCSDDATIKIWAIPDDFKEDVTESQSTLSGHSRKVNLILFNNSAEGVLASTSLDYTMKIWDVQKGEAKLTLSGPSEYCSGFEWGFNYETIASCWRDKHLRITDVRTEKFQHATPCHAEGGVNSQVCWLGEETLITLGTSRNRDREYSLWDLRNLEQPTLTQRIDNANGVLYPFFDRDLGILYTAGKGDGNIKYFEFVDGELHTYANDYRSSSAGKGYGFLPKYAMNSQKNEIARFAKLGDQFVELISYICPRRAEFFQEDLFPDCAFGTSITAEDWFKGQNGVPKKVSMRPSQSEVLQSNQGSKLEFVQKERPSSESPQKEQSKGSSSSSSNNNNKALQEEIEALKEKVENLTNLNRSLQEKLSNQHRETEIEKPAPGPTEIESEIQRDIEKQKELISTLGAELQSLRQQNENSRIQSGEIQKALKQQIDALNKVLAQQREKSQNQSTSSGLGEEQREKLNDQIKQLQNENQNMINQRNALQEILFKHGSSVKAILQKVASAPEDIAGGEFVTSLQEASENLKTVFLDLNLEDALKDQ